VNKALKGVLARRKFVVTTVTVNEYGRETAHRWPVYANGHEQAVDAVKAHKPVGHSVVAVGLSTRKPIWSL
jgi:hypothetical protein